MSQLEEQRGEEAGVEIEFDKVFGPFVGAMPTLDHFETRSEACRSASLWEKLEFLRRELKLDGGEEARVNLDFDEALDSLTRAAKLRLQNSLASLHCENRAPNGFSFPREPSLSIWSRRGEPHPLYIGVEKSIWFQGSWMVEVMGRSGPLYLGPYETAEDAARAYDRASLGLWGRRATLNFREFNVRGLPVPATHISGCCFVPRATNTRRNHTAIQIEPLDAQVALPAPTSYVDREWVNIKTAFRGRTKIIISRTEGIPRELFVGLMGGSYQYLYQNMSTTAPHGNRS